MTLEVAKSQGADRAIKSPKEDIRSAPDAALEQDVIQVTLSIPLARA
jgi:hypothetical protein